MAPKTSRVGGLLAFYLSVCVLVGAVWVGIARRRVTGADRRQDLEALVGGMMIFGAVLALVFAAERPLISLGAFGDGLAGLMLGMLVGFVVTGVSLVIRVRTDITTET